MLEMCEKANAWPAFGFHLIEVFQTGEVSRGVTSSSLSSLFTDWIRTSEVVDTSDLHRFSALLGAGEDGEQGQYSNDQQVSH